MENRYASASALLTLAASLVFNVANAQSAGVAHETEQMKKDSVDINNDHKDVHNNKAALKSDKYRLKRDKKDLKRTGSIVMKLMQGGFPAFFILSGCNHFLHPAFYMRMMPSYLPWHRALVQASGAAEMGPVLWCTNASDRPVSIRRH